MSDAAICLLLVDGVVAFALLEAACLAAWRLATGQGLPTAELASNLSAGLCLLGALHGVLAGAAWPACALWLAAAGVAHAADMIRRWRTAAQRSHPGGPHACRSSSISP